MHCLVEILKYKEYIHIQYEFLGRIVVYLQLMKDKFFHEEWHLISKEVMTGLPW